MTQVDQNPVKPPSTPRVAWRLLRNDPPAFVLAWALWVLFHATPLAVGWVLKLILDAFTDGEPGLPIALLAALLGIEAGRWTNLIAAAVQWHGAWVGWQTVPRVNMLQSLAVAPGPTAHRLPGSPGEAVSRFRDDVQDVALVLDVWLDVSGAVISATIALAVMAAVSPYAALSVVIPVGAAMLASIWLGPRLRRWRRAAREAGAQVTSFIGDTFGSILAVKAAGAEAAVDARFVRINEHRATVARRDRLGSELTRALGYGTGEITTGVVLLIVAASFRRGDVTVGDIALLTSYVGVVAGVPKWVGRLGAYHRQAEVSLDRLGELIDGDRRSPVRSVRTHLRHGPPPLESAATRGDGLRTLRIEGLTVTHPSSGRGIFDASLTIERGELVALTGPVGSGKSTLLRGLLGLVEAQAGTITWNDAVIDDPSVTLVPPRVAYLPQVPRLFSESLADTVLLGVDPAGLLEALWLACMDDDLTRMPDGVETLIGPRGLRLSGGQVQRTAAARALVRAPELLVVDDLSSALDVETEITLWERVRSRGFTSALLVSHRHHVLDHADRVVTLDNGRVVS